MAIVGSGNLGLRGTGLGDNRSLKDEFGGSDNFSDYVRGGEYVPDGPPLNESISDEPDGLEMSQFYGATNQLSFTVVAAETTGYCGIYGCAWGYYADTEEVVAVPPEGPYGTIDPDPFPVYGSNIERLESQFIYPWGVYLVLGLKGQGKDADYFTSLQVTGVFADGGPSRTQLSSGLPLLTLDCISISDNAVHDTTDFSWDLGGWQYGVDEWIAGNSYDIVII
jgi:hypothetical protein